MTEQWPKVKVLHVLNHSLPVQDGYALRTRSILLEQRALGWKTAQVTSSKHEGDNSRDEEIDGLLFHRTQSSGTRISCWPILNQWDVVRTLLDRLEHD